MASPHVNAAPTSDQKSAKWYHMVKWLSFCSCCLCVPLILRPETKVLATSLFWCPIWTLATTLIAAKTKQRVTPCYLPMRTLGNRSEAHYFTIMHALHSLHRFENGFRKEVSQPRVPRFKIQWAQKMLKTSWSKLPGARFKKFSGTPWILNPRWLESIGF